MAILRPFDIAAELISEVELEPLPQDPIEAAKLALNQNRASIHDAARAISEELDNEKTKLAAAKLVMEMHGAIKKDSRPSAPSINIQILGSDRSLVKIVTPVMA